MLTIEIPDVGTFRLEHLVLDFNGTLARDGQLIEGVRERLAVLSRQMAVHVVTGDTFCQASLQLAGLPCKVTILAPHGQSAAKEAYVDALGPTATVCVGNGGNDQRMMEKAALAIAVIQDEGSAASTLSAADVVVCKVVDALDLLIHPLRLIATLRR